MYTEDELHMMAQLQQICPVEQTSVREERLLLAAQTHHRQRLLSGDRPRLEDMAQEWIELLNAHNRNAAD